MIQYAKRYGNSVCPSEYFQVTGSSLTAGHLQATLTKLLTYGVLRST